MTTKIHPYVFAGLEPIEKSLISEIDEHTIELIRKIIIESAKVFGLCPTQLKNGGRKQPIPTAKRVCINLMFNCLRVRQPFIGKLLNIDRTSVLYHIKHHHTDMTFYKPYREAYNQTRQIVFSNET